MKRFRIFLASFSFLAVLSAPLLTSGVAQASVVSPIHCRTTFIDEIHHCDMGVDKKVSVNGGGFVDADSSVAAAPAHVGDTVTWQITVTNHSTTGDEPTGFVYVKDVLPSGVTYQSSVASDGQYITDSSSIFFNDWYLPLLKADPPNSNTFVSTLPATLTITTKATTAGLFQNTAAFNKYDPGSCDGGCSYLDFDATNNSNDAWVNIQTAPKVLAASTTSTSPNTGFGTPQNNTGAVMLASLGLIGLVVSFAARKQRDQ